MVTSLLEAEDISFNAQAEAQSPWGLLGEMVIYLLADQSVTNVSTVRWRLGTSLPSETRQVVRMNVVACWGPGPA